MAKKKTKHKTAGSAQQPISLERYFYEKARSLPIHKCYVNPDWQEGGLAEIIVSRMMPSGKLIATIFLVDTFCLGVKSTINYINITQEDIDERLETIRKSVDMEEVSYNEVHNIIYGAIGWAEEGGIQPCKGFKVSQYILEEDTEDIPLIDYEFGKDGRHLLFSIKPEEMQYISVLQKNLGDKFDYVVDTQYIFGEDLDLDGYDEIYLDEDDFDEDENEVEDLDEKDCELK